MKDCLVCGREIELTTKGFCRRCWYPLSQQLAARLHRQVSAADVAAMLLWDHWSHDRERAAA